MNTLLRSFIIAACVFAPIPASAASPNRYRVNATIGTSATAMTMLPGLCGYYVMNCDSAVLYWDTVSTVTADTGATTSGMPIPAAVAGVCASFSWQISYQSAASGTTLYFISAAGTGTRLIQYRVVC